MLASTDNWFHCKKKELAVNKITYLEIYFGKALIGCLLNINSLKAVPVVGS